jgi:7-cyano-7-deazaguanine synthase
VDLAVTHLMLAAVKSDGFHADGTEEFIRRLSELLELQEGHLSLSAPAIRMSSAELVRQSRIPISILGWSHSCHTGNFACGTCRGCNKHRATMMDLGHGAY